MPTEQQNLSEAEVDYKPGEESVDQPDFDYDQKPEAAEKPKVEEKSHDDILNDIVPKAEPHTWVIGPPDMERTFIQKPLSFIAKMQWFSLVGNVLDKALSGPQGMSLNSLFSAPGRPGELTARDFRDADTFVQAISKLLSAAPDFLVDSYLIWLNVPDYDRGPVRDLMKLPADEGGLSDDQGMEIIEIFLDQNYDALASFFGERLQALQNRVAKLNELRQERK